MSHTNVYRLIPVWQLLFTIPGLICVLLLYRSWKRYGGDGGYVPPVPGETTRERLSEEIPEEELSLPGSHIIEV